ncbi:hypothetical protein D3C71_1926470 [compost metagenome]
MEKLYIGAPMTRISLPRNSPISCSLRARSLRCSSLQSLSGVKAAPRISPDRCGISLLARSW